MSAELSALASSAAHLSDFVGRLVPDDLTVQAFPSEWTVAETLAHIGSGAVISLGRIEACLAETQMSSDAIYAVWDEWNAKAPQQQAGDVLMADAAFVERITGLTDKEKSRVLVDFGPISFDYDTFVKSRVAEHAIHLWDARVALDPTVTVEQECVEIIIDGLGMTAAWGGKTDGALRLLSVRTTDPERGFVVATDADGVALTPTEPSPDADIVLPAEAFIRLVYGRLPVALTPAGVTGEEHLAELRTIFRGI